MQRNLKAPYAVDFNFSGRVPTDILKIVFLSACDMAEYHFQKFGLRKRAFRRSCAVPLQLLIPSAAKPFLKGQVMMAYFTSFGSNESTQDEAPACMEASSLYKSANPRPVPLNGKSSFQPGMFNSSVSKPVH